MDNNQNINQNNNQGQQDNSYQYQHDQGQYQQQQNQYQQGYQQPGYGYYQKGPVGETRSSITVLILSIVTCGIYYIYWHYKVSEEINNYMRSEATSPSFAILGIFCVIFSFLNIYKVDQAIFDIDSVEGRRPEKRYILWLLLSLVFGIGTFVMVYQVQESLNTIWAGNNPYNYNQPNH